MAKIRGLELPAEYSEYLVGIMSQCPDEVMANIGKSFLPVGMARAHVARERVAAMLRGPAEIEVWLLSLLAEAVPGKKCVEKLSAEGLRPFADAMLRVWPQPNVVAPLLLSQRSEVQKLGAELLTRGLAGAPPLDKAEGQQGMIEFVNNFFLGGVEVEATFGPVSIVPPRVRLKSGEIQTREQFIRQFNALTDSLGGALKGNKQLVNNLEEQKRKHKVRMDALTRQAAEDKRRLVMERDQAASKARRAEKERAALEERLRQAEAKAASVVARELSEQTSAMVRKWLGEPLTLERQVEESEPKVKDVLERAAEALQAQAAKDRVTGNRRELERSLEKLRTTREQLADAASTALRPLPELKGLLAELDEQILGVQKILAKDRVLDPLTERLLIAINQAANAEQARACSGLTEQAGDLGLIPRADRRRLADALQRKFSVLEELAKGERLSVCDYGWALRDVIFRDRTSLIVLDGFNVLFGMEDFFRADYEPDGRPGRRAAERLVSVARRLTERRTGVRVRIFFDSPEHEVIPVSENLTIEYSGGQGEHRADRRMAELIEFRRADQLEEKWFLVSDDREVRCKAVAGKAQPVTVDVFAVLLNDFGCLNEVAGNSVSQAA